MSFDQRKTKKKTTINLKLGLARRLDIRDIVIATCLGLACTRVSMVFRCFAALYVMSKAGEGRSAQAAQIILGILYLPPCLSMNPRGLPQGAFLPWIAGTAIDSNAIVLKLELGRSHRFPEPQLAVSQVDRIYFKSLAYLRAVDILPDVPQGRLRVDLAEVGLEGDIGGSVLEGASNATVFGLEGAN